MFFPGGPRSCSWHFSEQCSLLASAYRQVRVGVLDANGVVDKDGIILQIAFSTIIRQGSISKNLFKSSPKAIS